MQAQSWRNVRLLGPHCISMAAEAAEIAPAKGDRPVDDDGDMGIYRPAPIGFRR
jgi:hypothetical protein